MTKRREASTWWVAPSVLMSQAVEVVMIEVLGRDLHGGVWFRRDDETRLVTEPRLARLRSWVAEGAQVRHEGIPLDESDVCLLIDALGSTTPLWPTEPCRWCGTDAVAYADGFLCAGHLAGFGAREEEAS